MKPASNFAPWSETENPAPSPASDAGGSDALQQAAQELSQAVSQLTEWIQQLPASNGSSASMAPLSIQITVTDSGGNSLPFTTPDGPDLSLFS